MNPDENARVVAFYNAARAEVIQRLSLCEQVLLAYLTVSGVVAGVANRTGTLEPRALIIVPMLAFPFVLALLRHDESIHRLGQYITVLRPHLTVTIGDEKINDWDGSDALKNELNLHLVVEKFTYAALMIGPGVACLFITSDLINHGHKALYITSVISVALGTLFSALPFVRLFKELVPFQICRNDN